METKRALSETTAPDSKAFPGRHPLPQYIKAAQSAEGRAIELERLHHNEGSTVLENETDVSASDLWAIYGTLRAAELLAELLPQVLAKVEVISGDGGVGTILQLTYPPGEVPT